MDQYLSTIIIAVITGIFSVITLIIQKRQDKIISKIDEQTLFIEKEKNIKQKLSEKEKELSWVINEIMLLILDTNLKILQTENHDVSDTFTKSSDDLKQRFAEISKSINDINKEYRMVIEMTHDFEKEMKDHKKK